MKVKIGKFEITFERSGSSSVSGRDDCKNSGAKQRNRIQDRQAAAGGHKGLFELDNITTLEFVSHELKGILGSTIMCVYSIRDGFLGMLNFKQRATIETIIRNLRRLESTIKDFLDISKIEGGRLSSQKAAININTDVIKEVEDAFLSEIYEKGLLIENNIPGDLVIKTDRTLLLTVFNNLISNAIKYGKSGAKIIINVRKPEKLYEFSVYNDGEPIKDDEKEKLFKKFSRIESDSNKKVKGTGLGLFIVKNIVNTLGGDISINTFESGNEFVFDIEGE
jgi:signal transduction histidine kinase